MELQEFKDIINETERYLIADESCWGICSIFYAFLPMEMAENINGSFDTLMRPKGLENNEYFYGRCSVENIPLRTLKLREFEKKVIGDKLYLEY